MLRRALRYSPGTWAYSESSKYYDIVAEKENVPAVALLKVLGRDYSNNNAYSMLKKLKEWNSLSEYEKWFCLLAAPMREDGVTALNLGFDVYSMLVDELLKYNITPYVTLYHWDLPYALYLKGGWLNPESSAWFEEYTRAVAKKLGDRVKHFITFNEPSVFMGCGKNLCGF